MSHIHGYYPEGFPYHYKETFENGKVEHGLMFAASHTFIIAPLSSYNILLKIGRKYCHNTMSFASNSELLIEMYRNPIVSGDGTPIGVNNCKCYSTNVAATTLFHTPTLTNAGEKIFETVAFGSGGKQAMAGSASPAHKIMFAPNTSYVIRFTSLSSNPGPENNSYRGLYQINLYETLED